jgi:CheY-like chemotaxis protein
MEPILNCVLLIDDDDATNFYHKVVINKVGCAKQIVAVQNGKAALEYLKSTENGDHPQPDLIFLDINMPAMNGWEFLEEYKLLDEDHRAKVIMIMLTTSLNPADQEKANSISDVNGFLNKPLTREAMKELLNEHFPS